jgi:CheY-like chemotaxis protein
MKILIIEDEPASLKLAHVVLTAEGNEVIDATAAEQAMEAIAKNEPQIILLDLELPGTDGLTLARRLKRDPKTAHIPIVAITAYPNHWSREQAMAAGCDAYIVKPINTRSLASDLTAVAGKPRR